MKNRTKLILIGAGGHAASIADAIFSTNEYEISAVLASAEMVGSKFLNMTVLGTDNMLFELFNEGISHVFVAIGSVGDVSIRSNVFKIISEKNFILPNIIDASALVSKDANLGKGIFVGKKAVINARSNIGDMAIINTGSIIEHDCCVGDYAHIAPGAVLCGGVSVGDRTHIGANATVIQNITIGKDCMIGAGSVVVKNIPDNSTCYGNPCRRI